MNVNLVLFAHYRELLGCSSLQIELTEETTITELCLLLAKRGEAWSKLFTQPSENMKVAVNHQMVDFSYTLTNNQELGDSVEVAFFPPVTGG